ncbi:tRNA dihydrouridine synthase DusB [Bdellovibrio sp. SKB1291214]|uniref:tRNA dihydrouridine synthase DusB n=1 Tax=Bdellovibrio sp. SKB1291214 TaxID=1732569 RepID=UPI000B51B4C5|nr:tRNA dihydrouridine synthase DusB [Bdellovibrio sp. SKB1291214]UYL10425.1 tRNA dihydrouridine synthase DusB [Bdellovibrio sp. SKB1291214]
MNPVQAIKTNPFVLAPMAGITDHAFRTFMKKLDASVVVTELVSASGIEYKSEKTLKLMGYDEVQRPIGIQLFGEDPEILARAAQFAEADGCDFIDLNFGCPVPKVVKKGAGSAMLKDPVQMQKVLSAVKAAVKIPVTIKIRTGWDSTTRNASEICNIAYNEGMEWVAIHGRTRNQGYTGFADWDFITEVKANAKLPILGNGDILTPKQAVLRLEQSGCDGVMIGRGCLKNPFIFMDALSLWRGEAIKDVKRDYVSLFNSLKTEIVAHCDEHITGIQLRKFAAWFSTGYPGAAQFRKNLFQSKSNEEIMDLANEFFAGVGNVEQEDQSKEDFLMGGHG